MSDNYSNVLRQKVNDRIGTRKNQLIKKYIITIRNTIESLSEFGHNKFVIYVDSGDKPDFIKYDVLEKISKYESFVDLGMTFKIISNDNVQIEFDL